MSKEKLHAVALLIGSTGLLLIGFVKNQYQLLLSFAFIGIAWSSISNIPYKIISDNAPQNKLTAYFTIFNFSIVIPQITAAFLLGYVNKHFFKGETIDIIFLGAGSMCVAGITMLLIKARRFEKN